MRWTLALLTVGTLLTVGLIAATAQKAPSGCTQEGTSNRDIMAGTKHADVLCALEGDDYAHGDGSGDVVRAGAGNDVVVGGGGKDVLRGGRGADRLFAVDDRGGERVIGGKGRDQCFVDRGDVTFGCERTFRGLSLKVIRALTQTAFALMVIAEEQAITVTVTVPIPGPPGPTGPPGSPGPPGNFPPCTPPPNHSPAPC